MNNTDQLNTLSVGIAAQQAVLDAMNIAYTTLRDGFVSDQATITDLQTQLSTATETIATLQVQQVSVDTPQTL